MEGYAAILLEANNIAHRQAMAGKVLWLHNIEPGVDFVKHVAWPLVHLTGKITNVKKVIFLSVNLLSGHHHLAHGSESQIASVLGML